MRGGTTYERSPCGDERNLRRIEGARWAWSQHQPCCAASAKSPTCFANNCCWPACRRWARLVARPRYEPCAGLRK
eukprot:12484424-Alexandrium_andersonii.AAC.1